MHRREPAMGVIGRAGCNQMHKEQYPEDGQPNTVLGLKGILPTLFDCKILLI
jgi:hypothetical protein